MPLPKCELLYLRCNNDLLEETQTCKKDGLGRGSAATYPILGNTPSAVGSAAFSFLGAVVIF